MNITIHSGNWEELQVDALAIPLIAGAAPDAARGVPHWRQVLEWTRQAADIRGNHPEVAALEQAAQGVLDGADRVERVGVEAITADGFRADANLVKILARGSSVYALDETNQSVYRAVLTTSGEYQLDPVFECRRGLVGIQSIEALVDITWLSRPNVVGQDTLLVLDPGGRLLYCTTDGVAAAIEHILYRGRVNARTFDNGAYRRRSDIGRMLCGQAATPASYRRACRLYYVCLCHFFPPSDLVSPAPSVSGGHRRRQDERPRGRACRWQGPLWALRLSLRPRNLLHYLPT